MQAFKNPGWLLMILSTSAFIGAFSVAQETNKTTNISAIVLPHHDVVKQQRQDFLTEVSKRIQPQTIILISPNHFDTGKENIQTSSQTWQLSNSTFEPNISVIKSLNLADQPSSFMSEHGIKNVLGDLKQNFPKAQIVPIIIKQNTSQTDVDKLETNLKTSCNNCLLVASVDFSHYQPAILAELHDELTIRALNELDQDTLFSKAEVDSPASLYLIAKWASDHDTQKFTLQNHTNTGLLTNNPNIETTSHVFGWYEQGSQTTSPSVTSFIIGNDLNLKNNSPVQALDQLGDRVFWGTDIIALNNQNFPSSVNRYLHLSSYNSDITTSNVHILKTNSQPSTSANASKHPIIINTKNDDTLAQNWINAGANMVIQYSNQNESSQIYSNKPILKLNQTLVAGKFTDTDLELFFIPTKADAKNKIILANGADKNLAITNLSSIFSEFISNAPGGKLIILPY